MISELERLKPGLPGLCSWGCEGGCGAGQSCRGASVLAGTPPPKALSLQDSRLSPRPGQRHPSPLPISPQASLHSGWVLLTARSVGVVLGQTQTRAVAGSTAFPRSDEAQTPELYSCVLHRAAFLCCFASTFGSCSAQCIEVLEVHLSVGGCMGCSCLPFDLSFPRVHCACAPVAMAASSPAPGSHFKC